jgi:hypothetical protein
MSSMNDAASWLTTSARCARRRPRPPGRPAAAGRHRAHRIVHERQPRRPREEQRHRGRDKEREREDAAVEPDLANSGS